MRRPPALQTAAESVYLRVPVPGEVVEAVRKHADAARELARLAGDAATTGHELVAAFVRAFGELEADAGRAKRALAKRKGRRKR